MGPKVLTNANWAQLAPLFPRKGPQAKRRLRLEGILWIHRTGAPWRDLPACFAAGCGRGCGSAGAIRWARTYEALYIDRTSVPAHRHSAGVAPAQSEQAIGTSRGGRGTKVHAVCDALGYPAAVELTGA